MTTPDPREERLRARLASYGAALEAASDVPAPRPARHLVVVVDGPVGGGRGGRRRVGQGPVGRVAAAIVVLAAVAGTTWAATRTTEPVPTTTEGRWADDDVVRPEDRPSAFAALDGSWPLPPDGSLRYVIERPTDVETTFAAFRGALADQASCLWFRTAVEEPVLTAEGREALGAMAAWPGHAEAGPADRAALGELVAAAEAGDTDRLRTHLAADCRGSGAGLGLPEIGRYWLVPGGEWSSPAAFGGSGVSSGSAGSSGSAAVVDPTQIPGWTGIAERLGPDVTARTAIALPGGGFNVAMAGPGLTFSVTIGRVDGPVTLPVTRSAFDAGYVLGDDGVEVYAGPVGGEDEETLVHAVGPGGASVSLSFGTGPDRVEDALAGRGDLGELAVDLPAGGWRR